MAGPYKRRHILRVRNKRRKKLHVARHRAAHRTMHVAVFKRHPAKHHIAPRTGYRTAVSRRRKA